MTEELLLSEIHQLPENLQLKVLDYVIQLKGELKEENKYIRDGKRVFGALKGKFKMSPDFDEPLDDFNDYR
ncbi:MAG: DUF2281 domain-containing protein [Cytophagales bacterium]|nr:DUF2281 domain-containing protein [Cytophagales bacterium]